MARGKPWQDRVVLEHRELMIKIDALEHFLATADIPNMGILALQLTQMKEYATTLHTRIKEFQC